MNLHGIVRGAITSVNPDIPAVIAISTGYTVADEGTGRQVPSYLPRQPIRAQVQPLTWRDIQQLDGMTLEGTRRKIYVYGRLDGLVRPQKKGGDLIYIQEGVNKGTWLVAIVLEQWPDWASVAATLQNESTC